MISVLMGMLSMVVVMMLKNISVMVCFLCEGLVRCVVVLLVMV